MNPLKRNLARKTLRILVPAILAATALVAVLPGTAQPAFPGTNGTIAFTREEGGGLWIRVVNPDGAGDTRLTETGSDSTPAPSPDGRKIAFSSFRNGDDEIYVMNADGSGQTRLTTAPGDDVDPAWSPDGQKLAFASSRDGDREIYVMNADGSGRTRLT